MILQVSNIYTSYGLSQILFGVSLQVGKGEVVSLLGRNGVGKTTTLRSIMGLTPPHSGSIFWKGEEIAGKPAGNTAASVRVQWRGKSGWAPWGPCHL